MKENFTMLYATDVKMYGINPAAILGRIKGWCESNAKAKRYFYKGYYWSGHITLEEMSEQIGLPYETTRKNLKWLIDNNIVIKDNFNSKKYDRTGWYRPNASVQLEQMEVSHKDRSKCPNRTNVSVLKEQMQLSTKDRTIPTIPTTNQTKSTTTIPITTIPFVQLTKQQRDKLSTEELNDYWNRLEEFNNSIKQIEYEK